MKANGALTYFISPFVKRPLEAAHLMFGEALIQVSQHARASGGELFSEFVATFGLLCVIWGCARLRSEAVPIAVGLYITGAYWFTASTSFANPAVTLARAFTNTFSGIRPVDAPGFIGAQLLGAFTATILFRWFLPALPSEAKEVVFPQATHSADGKTTDANLSPLQ
jgi:glycerol uptake facilitator-like aquaporin